MANSKKPTKRRLPDEEAGVCPPWQAWHHPGKNKVFYCNTETKESIWEHPGTSKSNVPSTSNQSTKRRIEKRKEEVEEWEKMEVDEAPPPKRKHQEEEEGSSETKKRRMSVETPTPSVSTPQVNKSIGSSQIVPNVSWADEVNPYHYVGYSACVVFDTCSLVKRPEVLNESVQKMILCVIPYAVLTELDGLKNKSDSRTKVMRVNRQLKEFRDNHCYYIRLETSAERHIKVPGYIANESVADDSILRCALRTKAEILSISDHLHLLERSVLFVTDDIGLSLKASAHDLYSELVDDYIDEINGRSSKSSSEKKSERRSTSRIPAKPEKERVPQHSRTVSPERPDRQMRRSYEEPRSNTSSFRHNKSLREIQESRKTAEWISGMLKNSNTEPRREIYRNEVNNSQKPRPSIPLADEMLSLEKPEKLPYHRPNNSRQSTYKPTQQIVKPTKTDRIRPQMPLSLSDDEDNGMDVS